MRCIHWKYVCSRWTVWDILIICLQILLYLGSAIIKCVISSVSVCVRKYVCVFASVALHHSKLCGRYLFVHYTCSHSHNLTWKKQPQIKWVSLQTPNLKKNTGKWEWGSWRENGQNKRSGEIITDSCFEHSHGQRKRGKKCMQGDKGNLVWLLHY